MKKMNGSIILALIGVVLLAATLVKEFFPTKMTYGTMASEMAKGAVELDGYMVERDMYLALTAYARSWKEAEFQSDEVELFKYDTTLNQVLSAEELYTTDGKNQAEAKVRAVKLVGEIDLMVDIPLGRRTFVDLKTIVRVPGHPEPYLRVRVEGKDKGKGKYLVGLVRLSDAVPKPFTRQATWAPTDQLVPTDAGTEVVSTFRAVVEAGQWTESKTVFIPQYLVDTSKYTYWLNILSVPQSDRQGDAKEAWEYTLNGKTNYLLSGDMSMLAGRLGTKLSSEGAELSLHLLRGGPARATVVITVYRKQKEKASVS